VSEVDQGGEETRAGRMRRGLRKGLYCNAHRVAQAVGGLMLISRPSTGKYVDMSNERIVVQGPRKKKFSPPAFPRKNTRGSSRETHSCRPRQEVLPVLLLAVGVLPAAFPP